MKTKIEFLENYVGRLSAPDKMPGYGYSIPAWRCKMGKILMGIPGSICSSCYAMTGAYIWAVVKNAMNRRYYKIKKACLNRRYREKFINQFSQLLNRKLEGTKKRLKEGKHIGADGRVFRWHDSGDLQSETHLDVINRIALATKGVKHWLPSREYAIIKSWLRSGGIIAPNLCIRLSAHYIDQDPVSVGWLIAEGCTVSSAHTEKAKLNNETMDRFAWRECEAYKTKKDGKLGKVGSSETGYCGSCRRCWNRKVTAVSYPLPVAMFFVFVEMAS